MVMNIGRQRTFLLSFALTLALLLGIWSYSSFASSTSLTVTPNPAQQNNTVTLIGTGFSPDETVAIWITYPDYRVFAVAEVAANDDGDFNYPYVPDFLGATFTPTGKYVYTAHGKSSGREVYAELDVNIADAPGTSSDVSISVEPGQDDQGSYFLIRGANYGTEEQLGLWLRYPDNSIEDLGQITSGPSGSFEYVLRVTGVPVGHYAFTARGIRTGLNGIAEFDVTVGDLTTSTGEAHLTIRPTDDDQRSYAIFEGWGFQPKEIVSVWVTLPDYSTLAVGDVKASEDGAFVAYLYLGEWEPTGQRTYTAFGNASQLRAIADYTLQPGGDPPTDSSTPAVDPTPDAVCEGAGCSTSW